QSLSQVSCLFEADCLDAGRSQPGHQMSRQVLACCFRELPMIKRDFAAGTAGLCAQMPTVLIDQLLSSNPPQPEKKRHGWIGCIAPDMFRRDQARFLDDVGWVDATLKPAIHAQCQHPLQPVAMSSNQLGPGCFVASSCLGDEA